MLNARLLAEQLVEAAEKPQSRQDRWLLLGALDEARAALLDTKSRAEPPSATEPLYTDAEAAILLTVKKSKVQSLRRCGELRSIKVGRKYVRIPKSAIDEYVERQAR